MAVLEHLVDGARENADAEILRHNAILRQTRGLAENPALQRVLLKVLGSKEEIAIAKEFDKATKSYSPIPLLRGLRTSAQHAFPRAQPYNLSGTRTNGTVCFACGLHGHIARNCRVIRGR